MECPVCSILENQLITIGMQDRKVLAKVSRANINISLALLKKDITRKDNRFSKSDKQEYKNYQFNQFWDQRYILFEKFDEGIKID